MSGPTELHGHDAAAADDGDDGHDDDTFMQKHMRRRNLGISSGHRRLYCLRRLRIKDRRLERLEGENSILHKHSHIRPILPNVT
jgi:hypothetical protein